MKALILNSGMGSRMGELTRSHPKCMTVIPHGDTILSRQLRLLAAAGVRDIVITTGYYDEVLREYAASLKLPVNFTWVKNPLYAETNYIYSIDCAREYLQGDFLLLHGDLVFEPSVLRDALSFEGSCMKVSSTEPLPEKDFKAVVRDGRIEAVGVEFFEDAMEAQALYKLRQEDARVWLDEIHQMCENGERKCYAEKALNRVWRSCPIFPMDAGDRLCAEIDTPEDLARVSEKLLAVEPKSVYMCFSTDVVHSGHIAIIRNAAALGRLTVGVMSDEAVAAYRHAPLIPYTERRVLFENIAGVHQVVEQKTLSYAENLRLYHPDLVVHGDDWQTGFQKPIRDEVLGVLAEYGGELREFPYSRGETYDEIEKRTRAELAMPDNRRARLGKLLAMKGLVTAIEAHSGLTGLIAEKTQVMQNGECRQFDAMWLSSLCDSTARGKPDIELVDLTDRFSTVNEIMEVTTKPIIFDGDTGGLTEHFIYTVRSLERMGVSMVIIEDKTGLKKNSLFGTEVEQTQDSIENFCAKIRAGKAAQKTRNFMICARIESLILERGMEDALTRAFAFVEAGADAIMIHSRKKQPDEIFEFLERFRARDTVTPVVLVPTSFNTVTEEEWKKRGANVIIYANQLTRTGFPAMQRAARTILENRRAKECDDMCMSIKEIITLIPEE